MDQETLYLYLRGETSPEEEERILEWLDADPQKNRQELNALRYTLSALDTHYFALEAKQARRRGVLRKIARYTAGAAAAAALIVGASFYAQKSAIAELSSRTIALDIPFGQRMQITLEDGSQVWLNAGTRLEYPVVFGKGERRVLLSGEAMFAVQHEQARPFVVETFATTVQVVGTKFNVVANEAAQQFSTALLEGSVKVFSNDDRETLFLEPNEVVTLVDGRLVKEVISDPVAMQWTEGIISLAGSTLPELMAKFEKAFGIRIVIRMQTVPQLDILRGKIRVADGVDHALKVVQLAADFEFSRDEENNLIVIE